jgi:hypothetical protein
MTTPITPPASTAIDFDLFALVTLAELWGLKGLDAFILAMQMRANGIDAVEGVRLFQDARKWVQ